jgi:hypothetical protein
MGQVQGDGTKGNQETRQRRGRQQDGVRPTWSMPTFAALRFFSGILDFSLDFAGGIY